MPSDATETRTSRRDSGPLSETLRIVRSLDGNDDGEVTLRELVEHGGEQGILPAVLLVALIAATPLSGIPGVSVVCGLLIALLSFELIFRFRSLYLPGRLKKVGIDADRLHGALDKIAPVLAWIDRHTGDRLTFLFHRPLIWVPQVICLLSGMAMPFLEVIPFSSSIVAIGVCLLSMAMLTRDGIFFLLAMIPYGFGLYLVTRVLT